MYRMISCIVAALLALCAAVAPVAADDIATCGKAAGDDAIAACSRLLRRNPRNAAVYLTRGNVYLTRGEYDRALADYNDAVTIDPKSAIAYYNRGNVYFWKGKYDRAIVDLDRATRLSPKFALAYLVRGLAYDSSGGHDQAVADYDRAIASYDEPVGRDPTGASAYTVRGVAYKGKGEYDRAVADLDRAIRLDPKSAESALAYAKRGEAYTAKGEYDRAIADLDEAIRFRPADDRAYTTRGEAYNGKGAYDRAIADLDRAIRLNPLIAAPYSHRGFAYGSKGDFDRAMADLDKALALNPKFARGYSNRAAIRALNGDLDRAIADASQAIRLYPIDDFAYTVRGKAYFGKGEYDRAITDDDQAIRINPAAEAARQNRERALAAFAARPPAAALPPSLPAGPQRRVALIIGNSAYRGVPALRNPRRDAEAVAGALRQTGFETVELAVDLDRDGMVKALRAFRDKADSADWALVYFAGHGIEVDRVNYLIPVDAQILDDRDIKAETVSYEELPAAINGAKALKLVILDACRVNPFKDRMHRTVVSRATDRGLAPPPEPDAGTLIAYSAKDGQVAADDIDGVNSPFARAFVEELRKPGVEVRRLFDFVRDDVMEATGRRQQPYTYQSLGRPEFYFVAGK